jgi:hypothetical protein
MQEVMPWLREIDAIIACLRGEEELQFCRGTIGPKIIIADLLATMGMSPHHHPRNKREYENILIQRKANRLDSISRVALSVANTVMHKKL